MVKKFNLKIILIKDLNTFVEVGTRINYCVMVPSTRSPHSALSRSQLEKGQNYVLKIRVFIPTMAQVIINELASSRGSAHFAGVVWTAQYDFAHDVPSSVKFYILKLNIYRF